eukprot:CAMPEP_0172453664 /NCGR_PEP_ID=MMETSP1065-20121228/10875_1 /TAXON_ID=265537 /ORGANISM="Amphiprora paludosa, Strain CCMP125" /LENGTH=249 /DNA_ID=CAMNT_0013205853 /DNA_START=156 /DNA_END=906 /DNA_ORIENTATION=-
MTGDADIQYWDDQLTQDIDDIQTLLDRIPSINDDVDKADAIDRAKSKLRKAKGTKRSYKMETRLVVDVSQRRKYESRLSSLDQQIKTLSADVKALEAENQRGELFVEAGGADGMDPDTANGNAQKAGDNMLKEAGALQDKTQDSLANTKNMIASSKEVGVATLEELERQRNVIENIDREVDRVDDNLARAEALLKQFGKRMASDQFIQCFAMINCLLLLGVILYAIIKGGGLNNSDDGSPVQPTRFLRN